MNSWKFYLFLMIGLVAFISFAHAASFSVINTINGTSPAFSPSGSIAYTINGLYINVVNVSTNKVIDIIAIPTDADTTEGFVGSVQAAAFSPNGKIAYVVTAYSIGQGGGVFSIVVINVSTNRIIANISDISTTQLDSVKGSPSVIFSPSGSTAYFTTATSTDPNVYVINVSTNNVAKIIGLPFAAFGITLNPSGTLLYAAEYQRFSSSSNVSIINTTTDLIVSNMPIGPNPEGIAINPSGISGYVTNLNNGTVSVFNTTTNKIVDTITIGASPMDVLFNLNGSLAYVADSGSNNVSVIAVNNNTVINIIKFEDAPTILAYNPNPSIPFLYVGNQGNGTTSVVLINSSTATPMLVLPTSISESGSNGLVKVTVSGSGFTPGTIVNLGYASNFPPDANAIFATTTNSAGGWSGTFSAPWNKGDYEMVAIDAKGKSATASLDVNTSLKKSILILPTTTPSSSTGLVNVILFGTGFTPNTFVNLGYSSNFPPYANAIFSTTTNSTGGWTGVFHAPWQTGSYSMTAIDADGVSATSQLVVTRRSAAEALILPSNVTPSNSVGLDKIRVSGTGFTPNTLVNLGYYPSFWKGGPSYNYANAIFATTTNSTGGWSGTFSAPWNAGSYTMEARDSAGINATSILTVK